MQNHRLRPKSKRRKEYDDGKLGRMGAASPCRRIDPETGEIIDILDRTGSKKKRCKSGETPITTVVKVTHKKHSKRKGNSLANAAERIMKAEEMKSPLLKTIR